MGWFDLLAPYDFAIRSALTMVLVSYGAYVMLRAGVFGVPQVGFMAIGAYVSAILDLRYGAPFVLSFVVALMIAAAIGALLALILVRLDGIRLAIATIAFSEIVRVVIQNLDVTGGAQGLVGVHRWTTDWELVLAVLVVLVLSARIARTRFGMAIDAMRRDVVAAAHQGVSIRRYRMAVFVTCALVSAAGGALQVHMYGFLVPEQFSFGLLTQILATVIVGGMTAYAGPILGGAIIYSTPHILTFLANYQLVFNGAVILLVISVAPGGVAELLRRGYQAVRDRSGSASTTRPVIRSPDASSGAVMPGVAVGRDSDPIVLSIRGLQKRFGGVQAIDNLSLDIQKGRLFGIIGPNGSGKTTLLNIISGAISANSGTISLAGHRIERLGGRPDRIARLGLTRTFQGIRLLRGTTVRENVSLGAYALPSPALPATLLGLRASRARDAVAELRVRDALASLDITAEQDSLVDKLPYGIQRRVEIARAAVTGPRVILLDEPTAGMTRIETAGIFEYLTNLCAQGVTVVIVEHDLHAMTKFCNEVAVLDHGRLLAVGVPSEVMRRPEVVEAYVGRASRN